MDNIVDDSKFISYEDLYESVEMGLDIEFWLRGVMYNISWRDKKPFISICPNGGTTHFKNTEDLLNNYRIDGIPLGELWHEIDIILM